MPNHPQRETRNRKRRRSRLTSLPWLIPGLAFGTEMAKLAAEVVRATSG